MSMRTRTTNKNIDRKDSYEGISSEYYKYYIDFYDDLYESYLEHVNKFGIRNTTLDRINPYGDYEKGNVRWATIAEQNNNTRKHKRKFIAENIKTGEVVIFSNQTKFSKKYGISKQSVNNLIKGRRETIKNWKINEL